MIGRTRRLLLALGLLLALALVVAAVLRGPRLLRDREKWGLLRDTSTAESELDWLAWNYGTVAVLRVAPDGAVAVEDRWLEVEEWRVRPDFEEVGHLVPDDTRLRLSSTGAEDTKDRVVRLERVLQFRRPRRSIRYGADLMNVAIIESGLVYRNLVGKSGSLGFTFAGTEEAVKARVLHIDALARLLRELEAEPRADLLEGFLQTNLGVARYEVLRMLGRSGPEGVPAFIRFLEREPDGRHMSSALYALRDSYNPHRGRELAAYLGRELTRLRAEAGTLQAGWAVGARSQRAEQLKEALDLAARDLAQDCASQVRELRALHATLPPSGDTALDAAVSTAAAVVNRR